MEQYIRTLTPSMADVITKVLSTINLERSESLIIEYPGCSVDHMAIWQKVFELMEVRSLVIHYTCNSIIVKWDSLILPREYAQPHKKQRLR